MYPRMHLGPVTLGSYLTLSVLGFLMGFVIAWWLARRAGISRRHLCALALGTAVAGVFGARWLHVWVHWERFQHRPLHGIFGVAGGRAFLGGALGGILFTLAYIRWARLPAWRMLDVIAPGLALGHAFGRLGCFAAGCCYGYPTDCPLGVPLYKARLRLEGCYGVPLHPVQLYEAAGLVLLFHFLLRLWRRRTFDGQVALGYFLGYGLLRFCVEFFRGDRARGFVLGGPLSTSQFISLLIVGGALLALWIRLRQLSRPAGDQENPVILPFPSLATATPDWPWARRGVWLALTVLALAAQGPSLSKAFRGHPFCEGDFYQEWASARNVQEGLPAYTPHSVTIPRYLGWSLDRPARFHVDVNAHPPTSVLLGLPLANVPYQEAHRLWNVVSLLFLAVAVGMVVHTLGLSRWAFLPAVVLLTGEPLRFQLEQGQLSCLLALLVTVCWWGARTGRARVAGATLALATAIKLFPAFLFLYFVARREWRVVRHGLLWLCGITLATAGVVGIEGFRDFGTLGMAASHEWRSCWSVLSLPALWAKLFHPGSKGIPFEPLIESPFLASALTLASAVAVSAVVYRVGRRAQGEAQQDGAFSLALIGSVLLSPISWGHGLLLFLVPAAWVFSRLHAEGVSRSLAVLATALLWLSPDLLPKLGVVRGWPAVTLTPLHAVTLASVQLYSLLGLFAVSTVVQHRLCDASHRTTPVIPDNLRQAA